MKLFDAKMLKPGDPVEWRAGAYYRSGKFVELTDDTTATVEYESKNTTKQTTISVKALHKIV